MLYRAALGHIRKMETVADATVFDVVEVELTPGHIFTVYIWGFILGFFQEGLRDNSNPHSN